MTSDAVLTDQSAPDAARPSAEEGLRERKKRATRRALRLAALRLVAERGLDGVTTEEVAAAADVSPRTFFNYFSGKEDALVGNDPDAAALLSSRLAECPPEMPPLDALRVVFREYARTVPLERDVWRLRMTVVEQNPSLLPALIGASAEMERLLTEAVAERIGVDPSSDPYPALVANVAGAVGRTALQHWGRDDTGPFEDLAEQLFDSLAAGLPDPTRTP